MEYCIMISIIICYINKTDKHKSESTMNGTVWSNSAGMVGTLVVKTYKFKINNNSNNNKVISYKGRY